MRTTPHHLTLAALSVGLLAACPTINPVECRDVSSCDLGLGGACVVAPSGNQWCAYPDDTCASGQRYSDQSVGDGLAGTCVGETDAGMNDVDAPTDARDTDANQVRDPVMVSFGNAPLRDSGYSIAPNGTGFVVGGQIEQATDFGGGPRSGTQFVARFNVDGQHIWSRGISPSIIPVITLTSDVDGNVLVGGGLTDAFSFGGSGDTLTPMGADGYVAKLAASSGAHVWSRRIGGSNNDFVYSLATFANGDVLVSGVFVGTINLGGGPLFGTGTQINSVVARLSGVDGSHVWSVALPGTDTNNARSVAIDTAGDVIVGGDFRGVITIGATTHTANGTSGDGFLAKLDGASGARVWSTQFGGSGNDSCIAVDVATDGGVLLTASYTAAFAFGSINVPHNNSNDVVVAKLNAASGSPVWATGFGSGMDDFPWGVGDIGGVVVVAASFRETLMFGTQSLTPVAGQDILVGKLNLSTGATAGAVRYGSSGAEEVGQLRAAGELYVITGGFQDSIDFGITTLNAGAGNTDIYAGMMLP